MKVAAQEALPRWSERTAIPMIEIGINIAKEISSHRKRFLTIGRIEQYGLLQEISRRWLFITRRVNSTSNNAQKSLWLKILLADT